MQNVNTVAVVLSVPCAHVWIKITLFFLSRISVIKQKINQSVCQNPWEKKCNFCQSCVVSAIWDLRGCRSLLVKWTMKPLKFSLGHSLRRLVRLWVSLVSASSLVWYPAQLHYCKLSEVRGPHQAQSWWPRWGVPFPCLHRSRSCCWAHRESVCLTYRYSPSYHRPTSSVGCTSMLTQRWFIDSFLNISQLKLSSCTEYRLESLTWSAVCRTRTHWGGPCTGPTRPQCRPWCSAESCWRSTQSRAGRPRPAGTERGGTTSSHCKKVMSWWPLSRWRR